MSIYDQRELPAYRDDFKPYKNQDFDKWWSYEHDQLIAQLIEKYQWNWYWEISDSIEKVTPKNIMDTLLLQNVWYNKVMYYAITRADSLGITKNIRKPEEKKCPLCNNCFVENSLPHPFVKRLGIKKLDFCSPCLKDIVFSDSGNNEATKDEIICFLNELANVIEMVPIQGFGEGMDDVIDFDSNKCLTVFNILKGKPSTEHVKVVFGSWFHALVEAGLLENGARKNSRGIQTLAKDGHMCFSLGEKTIDDYLYKNKIKHEREPKYPDSNYRADFKIGSIFLEYFGLTGNPDYDIKTKMKKRLCKKHGIKLISIYPKDLVSLPRLERKLKDLVFIE